MNVQAIRDQIQSAAVKAGRDPSSIILLGASKYADVEQVRQAYEQGLTCFGENRSEGLLAKKDLLPDDISWHFIGQLQTNKVKYIIDNVELIHSLDRLSLAKELQKRALAKQTTVHALVEVLMDDRESRGGVLPKDIPSFLDQCAQFDRLYIHGLMCVLSHRIPDNAEMKVLSMGMSHDFPLAIKHGATLVRVGSALFLNK